MLESNTAALCGMIGSNMAILSILEPGFAKDQLYKETSRGIAESGLNASLKASYQNELYANYLPHVTGPYDHLITFSDNFFN